MKKKLIVTAACGLLAAAVTAGATLAYFTNSDKATNVITMGNVSISLIDIYKDPGLVTPNQTIDKTVQVQNTGKNPAYVRVKLNRYWTDEEKSSTPLADLDTSFIQIPSYDTANWYYDANTDTYYYKSAVPAGEYTTKLFEKIHISPDAGNTYADKFGKVDVTAEAVQSDNFTPVVTNGYITSWGSVTIETTPSTPK